MLIVVPDIVVVVVVGCADVAVEIDAVRRLPLAVHHCRLLYRYSGILSAWHKRPVLAAKADGHHHVGRMVFRSLLLSAVPTRPSGL